MGLLSREEELKNVILVLRSLITSSKNPLTLQSVERDYKCLESEHIPYHRFGYRSTLEFLQDTKEFHIFNRGNEVIIGVKPNEKTAHIASMVRCQKASKSHFKPAPQSIRPVYPKPAPTPPKQNVVQQYQQKYQHQYLQKQQQQQQQVQQSLWLKEQQLQAERQANLERELLSLRQQQQAQEEKDLVIKRRQKELRDEQRLQKIQLQQQQEIVDKKIAELQQQHALDLKAQALTIDTLREESTRLKQQLKEQEQQQRLQVEQEQQQRLQLEQENTPPKTKPDVKLDAQPAKPQKLTPEEDSEAMNGNATGAGGGGGGAAAASTRKPHLRPILGNSAPQRSMGVPQPTNDSMSAGGANRRPPSQHARVPGTRPNGSVSVNYRLKQQQTAAAAAPLIITPPDSPENAANNQAKQSPVPRTQKFNMPQSQIQPAAHPSVHFKFDPAFDASSSLRQYCVAMGYAPPTYEFSKVNKSNLLHCKVCIDGNIYTSYPKEYSDETTAKQCTSEVALERLKQLESRKQLSKLSDVEFLDSIYKELIKHPHGIVSHKLPEWYEATVKRQVPSNWTRLLNESPKIRIESSVNTNIVFANTNDDSTTTPTTAASPIAFNPFQQTMPTAMPELLLPWVEGQQDWNMYITHCDNTMHVWARLIDQSANFEKLTEQLHAHMALPHNRQQQQTPIEQQIYLVEVSDNWNRVRVMSVDEKQRQCICHFVDFGDEVVFGFDVLYACPSMFLTLPAQAVCLSMYALDKFEDHPHAQPVLTKELAGHSVVTRIITSEAQFLKLGARTQGVLLEQQQKEQPLTEENGSSLQPSVRRACIVGTFYDTSTAEDIHLNDLVANQIIRNTPAPMLKLDQKSNNVIVSHVNDVGDLMIQLPNEDLKFVQRSISRIMSDSSEQHRVRYSDLLHDQLVCVCDESGDGTNKWYRGMLTSKPKSTEEEVFDVYYVDDGRLRKTHISNIYRLEANNHALAAFPAQALRVRLHDVPPIDNQMVGRLRGLLSPQTPVLLKVMEGANDKLPMVTIHARGQDSLYLCLNSAIRMEYEVQSTTRLEPFDDGGLHFSPSGQLIRRCSFSSTVSTHSSSSDQPTTVGIASPPATPRKPPAATKLSLPQLKEYEAIPAVGAYFEVRVALSVNPGHFAVQPYKCYNQLQHLMKELQAHCKSPAAQTVQPAQLSIGQAYAAADSSGVYHRVNIRKIYDEMIHVRYVDAGDDGVVRCNQLLQLSNEFRELPMMALPAQLYGIQVDGIDWTQENCLRFRKLTLGQQFIGIVRRVDKLKDDRRALSLELIDTSTPQDIKVHETLISEKHALPAP
ncbi:tudor domain-containing protein 7B isoform X1 [Drosophila sulfurigaster albostrigata]|uniref:tudor domain-containing protein 7B isoform X1 n=2 Tax=Drosophila sulfurigaster albostrigata TaxID=89887 RepID=UPI002D21C41C|nr:tudor domain-containing protein 7B isoform X1 [Drosophila sulfurigaster albostrigata]XP_062135152.1 tudor domain-containing protein 7B isoform X1 [Drosophila sulfurigaster albostrigata]